jgi:hypothetical protein
MTNQELVAGLRGLADFYEQNPELELPNGFDRLDVWLNKDNAAAAIRRLVKVVGKVEKINFGNSIAFRTCVAGFVLDFNVQREVVCERVQIGTKTIPERIIAAVAEEIVPEHEEPVYAWECGSLLKPKEEAVDAGL